VCQYQINISPFGNRWLKMLSFTIAICCYNSERKIGGTLTAIANCVPPYVQILVVDDGSLDCTREIALDKGIEVVSHGKNLGYGHARQTAFLHTKSDILVFIDDSCIVNRIWWENLSRLWEEAGPNTQAIAGPMLFSSSREGLSFFSRSNPFRPLYLDETQEFSLLNRLSTYFFKRYDWRSGYVRYAANGNLSFRRKALEIVGGYDPSCNLGGEDEDVCGRVFRKFGKNSIWFDHQLTIDQTDETTLHSTLRRSYKYGRVAAWNYKRGGGVPTFLPLPITYFTLVTIVSWLGSFSEAIATFLLMAYILNFKNRGTSIQGMMMAPFDFLIRIFSETANNIGFISFTVIGLLHKYQPKGRR